MPRENVYVEKNLCTAPRVLTLRIRINSVWRIPVLHSHENQLRIQFWWLWWQVAARNGEYWKGCNWAAIIPRNNKQSMGEEAKVLHHLQGSAQELHYSSTLFSLSLPLSDANNYLIHLIYAFYHRPQHVNHSYVILAHYYIKCMRYLLHKQARMHKHKYTQQSHTRLF